MGAPGMEVLPMSKGLTLQNQEEAGRALQQDPMQNPRERFILEVVAGLLVAVLALEAVEKLEDIGTIALPQQKLLHYAMAQTELQIPAEVEAAEAITIPTPETPTTIMVVMEEREFAL